MENAMPHEEAPDMDMIKNVLQKLVDDMNGLEAKRIHPKLSAPETEPEMSQPEEPAMDEEMTEDGLDPDVLGKLMEKAGSADESGELPEDKEMGLPDDVMAAVKRQKGTK